MSTSFNYILSQLKFDVTTLCNMKTNCFYNIIPQYQNHYQEGLGEKLLSKASFAKDVLYNIENACNKGRVVQYRECV